MTEFQLTPSSAVPQSPSRISAGAIIARAVLGLLAATALLILGILVALPFLASAFQLKAFRFPSDSMCPTICIHENFVVSMNAYRRYPPKRGDVVLHLMPNNRAPYVNRVIAMAGDTVSFGSHNDILVNDVPVTFPPVCGRPVLPEQAGSESHAFKTARSWRIIYL